MTIYEVTAVILSVLAILVSLINIYLFKNISLEQIKVSQGQAETELRQLIMDARKELSLYCEKLASFNGESKEVYNLLFESAQEDLRNAYEEACSRYIDGKVDKERFKRMYMIEIRRLVEDDEQKKYFDTRSSSYKCINKVYEEWNNLEK